jgi:hypothetical protein
MRHERRHEGIGANYWITWHATACALLLLATAAGCLHAAATCWARGAKIQKLPPEFKFGPITFHVAHRFSPQRRSIENPLRGFLFNTKPSTVLNKFITVVLQHQ